MCQKIKYISIIRLVFVKKQQIKNKILFDKKIYQSKLLLKKIISIDGAYSRTGKNQCVRAVMAELKGGMGVAFAILE
jgi:hypothetical protein